ncbi:hypothetical protein [Nocardia bovistercoris]|uniref:Uncharacterized protein n=1 Tax=Nocardia bovistercoris TaxID=2785916 RepID=A0A931IH43_9NOCA|nr:hypothetical protein [Nocardia bovistercoris]MBH0781662.1 hypothetical protein [Nocardia bovistercoris]
MYVHAYPTDVSGPVDLDLARRIVDRHLSEPGDRAAGITRVITEFDTGFTVIGVRGTPAADPRVLPPPTVGGSVYVIDKDTGAVSFWPTYPVTLVAESYSATVRAGGLIIADRWPDPRAIAEPAYDAATAAEIFIDYGLLQDNR